MKRKTHREFIIQIYDKYKSKYSIRSIYKNAKTKVEVKCNTCGNIFYSTPSNLLFGFGCKICANRRKSKNKSFSNKVFIKKLRKKHPNVICLEEYKNAKTSLKFKNLKCGHKFTTDPYSFLHRDISCPVCGRKGLWSKTKEDFIDDLKKINKNILVIGNYIKNNKKILVKNIKCNHTWKATPANLLKGTDCPKCKFSRGEKKISFILEENNIDYIPQKTFDGCLYKNKLKFDFYIKKINLLIEYNGRQHYEAVDIFGGEKTYEKQVIKDNIKKDFCKKNNINLLIIKYDEDIYSKLKSFIEDIVSTS